MRCEHGNNGECAAVCANCGHTCDWHYPGGKCEDTYHGSRYAVSCVCKHFVEQNDD